MDEMQELLASIEDAIEDEQRAQIRYKELKQQATNEDTKRLYEQLIEDEKSHEKTLRSRYQALKESRGED